MLEKENIAFLVAKVRRALRREFDSKFKKSGITPPQFDLLSRLWENDGLFITKLSKGIYKDGPTVTGLVDRLEKRKLIVRKRNEKDRRAIQIFLTEKGKSLKKELLPLAEGILKKATFKITPAEVDHLKILLEKIRKNLER